MFRTWCNESVDAPPAEATLSVSLESWRGGEGPERGETMEEAMVEICCTGMIEANTSEGQKEDIEAEAR